MTFSPLTFFVFHSFGQSKKELRKKSRITYIYTHMDSIYKRICIYICIEYISLAITIDRDAARARTQVAQSRFKPGGKAEVGSPPAGLQVRAFVVGIRALDWRRPASREGRDASQERTLILNCGRSCSERQFNERVFRGRITVVHPSGPAAQNDSVCVIIGRVTSFRERNRGEKIKTY